MSDQYDKDIDAITEAQRKKKEEEMTVVNTNPEDRKKVTSSYDKSINEGIGAKFGRIFSD